jgi:hypothetical protein
MENIKDYDLVEKANQAIKTFKKNVIMVRWMPSMAGWVKLNSDMVAVNRRMHQMWGCY